MEEHSVSTTPVDELIAGRIDVPLGALSQEAIEAYQVKALRRTLAYVKEKSDFYRERLAGFDPQSVQSVSDIAGIEPTSESDLAGSEWRFQCARPADIGHTRKTEENLLL